jgi:hypothetical protein
MSLLPRLSSLLLNLLHKESVEQELDAELSAFLDQLTEEKVAAGIPPLRGATAFLVGAAIVGRRCPRHAR